MENEQNKKTFKLDHILRVAMILMLVIIAILLISVIVYNGQLRNNEVIHYNKDDIVVEKSEDVKINSFIKDYFKAKTELNYPKIFSLYGRNYYEDERNDYDGTFNQIINRLKYEKVFVEDYEDIEVYTCNGLKNGEVVCIVSYSLKLGFTEAKAPMILIFYLKSVDGGYVISDDLDVGTSKYLVDVSNTKTVIELYDDTTNRLRQEIERSESLKLAYNSLRQFEVNQNVKLDDMYNNRDKLKELGFLEPIKDMDKIQAIITEVTNKRIAKEEAEAFFTKVVASLSEISE